MKQPVQRRLAAILAADVAGYSRLMGADEAGTAGALRDHRAAADPLIAEHGGRVVKTTGDGVLIEFGSVVGAVQCAIGLQKLAAERNAGVAHERRMEWRIGIHLGDVLVEGDDILGDGVNIAARLEGIAEPGGICISDDAFRQVRGKIEAEFADIGEQSLKNIARPLRVYRIGPSPAPEQPTTPPIALPLPDKPSIAVLPFANMSGDPDQEYFADGIAEDIITLLSRSRALFVISRNSSFTYKGRAVDLKQAARELGVRYVLEGSLRKAGNRVRVTAQLIEAATGGHLWAERYDRDLTDIFAVQDEITASVSGAILPAMERSERERAARKPPGSLDAWECYQRGLWHSSRYEATENGLAISFFERAVELDPGLAAAHAAMSFAFADQAVIFRPQAERQTLIPRAIEHAQRSIALDPSGALGHSALARALVHAGRHDEAISEADLAVSLDSNSAQAYHCQGFARAFGGRPHEALEPLETARRLSPFDPSMPNLLNVVARAQYWMGDYPAAVATARHLRRSYPNFQNPYRTLIAALGQTGQADEARHIMAEAFQRFGENFRYHMQPVRTGAQEDRAEDRKHLLDGYRKAGVLGN